MVKVQDGCNQFCAYCAIPYARSRRTSRPLQDILEEINLLADYGYKEVVLAGIRLGSYSDGSNGVAELTEAVAGCKRDRAGKVEFYRSMGNNRQAA